MARPFLNRLMGGFSPILVLLVSLLVSLYSMSSAMERSEAFGEFYFYLLGLNVIGLVVLLILIVANLARLIRQYRNQATGARLTAKLVFMFVMLVIVPVTVVYYFSLQFIQRGIDSWFDVRIGQAFESALDLSRSSLVDKKRIHLHQLLRVRDQIDGVDVGQLPVVLTQLRKEINATELVLFTLAGKILFTSMIDANHMIPGLPDRWVLRLAREQGSYVYLDDQAAGQERAIRVISAMNSGVNSGMNTGIVMADALFVQAVFPMPERLDLLSKKIETAYTHYQRLVYLHEPLKFSFILTLSLVLLLSVLSAIWVAFYFARRLVAPIRMLAIGTRIVASGDYDKRLPRYGNDEIGYLVDSFNEMTRRIARARDEVATSHQLAEHERAYLRTVLGNLSSGVLTLDADRDVTTVNTAASQILSVDLSVYVGRSVSDIAGDWPDLKVLVDHIQPCLEGRGDDWHSEVVLFGATGRRVLMCGGAALPMISERPGGHVIVFEDVTDLVQAQRDAAWGEVARRLAHEIKNPLTPIQLSAERLRRKYLKSMSPEDARVLDRATHTIVQQVEVMKDLVKAFSEYARTPHLNLRRQDLNRVIQEVCDLYQGESARVYFGLALDEYLPELEIDTGRIRQLMHNLIKNAIEAKEGEAASFVKIKTCYRHDKGIDYVEIVVADDGSGIPDAILGRVFEPYVTGKYKGSGLGLPIVKKIIEEHSGVIRGENSTDGGACFTMSLPLIHVTDSGAPVTAGPVEMNRRR